MRRINFRSQKGITLIILIITIVVLSILASVTVMKFDSGSDIRNYNYMCADIELLENKILVYYSKNGKLPIIEGNSISANLNGQASSRDNGGSYYQIDLSKLSNITLNYGGGNSSNKDIYIVNTKSHEVYYLKGIVYDGKTYHTPFK